MPLAVTGFRYAPALLKRAFAAARQLDGGGSVTARVTSDDPVRALLGATRAVATTGATATVATVALAEGADEHELLRTAEAVGVAASLQHADAGSAVVTGDIDEIDRATPMALLDDGDLIYWLGGYDGTDLTIERKVNEVLIAASRDGLFNAALDIGVGGAATTIAVMALIEGKGARFWWPESVDVEALFDAELGGVICIVPRSEELRFSDMCIARYLPSHRIGVVDGDQFELQGHFTIAVVDIA